MTTPLPKTSFLVDSSDKLRQVLDEHATTVTLHAGEVLFEQGDDGDALYAILSGTLEISFLSASGRKLSMDMMGPGQVIGEIALFDPGPRTATVTALTPSRLHRVRNADILRQIEAHPAMASDLIRLAGQRMRWMGRQMNEQVFLPLPARLARKLTYLTQVQKGDTGMLSLSQSELAEYVGATREAVSKTLASWKRDGLIEVGRKGLVILDRESLNDLADIDDI